MKTAAIIIAMLPMLASARLGETSDELRARFGAPVAKTINGPVYEKAGMRITATGYKGRCIAIRYESKGSLISDAQIKQLLESNNLGGGWVQRPRGHGDMSTSAWDSRDRRYTAVYSGTVLAFTDSKLSLEKQSAEDRARANATAGF